MNDWITEKLEAALAPIIAERDRLTKMYDTEDNFFSYAIAAERAWSEIPEKDRAYAERIMHILSKRQWQLIHRSDKQLENLTWEESEKLIIS